MATTPTQMEQPWCQIRSARMGAHLQRLKARFPAYRWRSNIPNRKRSQSLTFKRSPQLFLVHSVAILGTGARPKWEERETCPHSSKVTARFPQRTGGILCQPIAIKKKRPPRFNRDGRFCSGLYLRPAATNNRLIFPVSAEEACRTLQPRSLECSRRCRVRCLA